MILSIFSGLIAGILHTISGPDHLAAVAPFAAEKKQASWRTGLRWGAGHSAGVWLIGLVVLPLKAHFSISALSSWSEFLVGISLVGIGIWSLRKALKQKIHSHTHVHDGIRHTHFHKHSQSHRDAEATRHEHSHAPTAIGMLHGLAGSSHLFGIIPALMLPSIYAAGGYIIAFGLGSIIAMSGVSFVIGALAQRLSINAVLYNRFLLGISGLTIVIGIFWIYQTS